MNLDGTASLEGEEIISEHLVCPPPPAEGYHGQGGEIHQGRL
jgi:hypothetical protein